MSLCDISRELSACTLLYSEHKSIFSYPLLGQQLATSPGVTYLRHRAGVDTLLAIKDL